MECIFGSCIKALRFTIYDRWGEKVFETPDSKTCWDGRFKDKLMNSGTYIYYLDATTFNGDIITKNGSISLIR